jgi:hypothetical protein
MFRAVLWLLCAAAALAGCTSMGQRAGTTGLIAINTDCASAVVVGLRWDPPDGAKTGRHPTQYAVSRDGLELGTTPDTNFADTTVAASAVYSYSVAALRASGEPFAMGRIEVNTAAASPAGEAPYCKSSHIRDISWDWSSGYTEANGSDLWPVTWGKDGNVYTFFGDGGGFGGDNKRGRVSFGVAMLPAAAPLNPATARNLYGGYNAPHPSRIDGKAGSIIAVGNDFYTLGGLYGDAELRGVQGHKSGAPRRIQLAFSKGNAYSWQPAPWTFCSRKTLSPGEFCPNGFINFGPGNAGAPDGYVYMLGFANSKGYWQSDEGPEVLAERQRTQSAAVAEADGKTADHSPVNTYLARVSKRHVLQRDAYRYFAGLDRSGRPIWTDDQRRMRPIFTDRNPSRPGCGGQCNMASPLEDAVYNRALGRYIGTAQGDYIGQTSFYDAPHPWGPWTTISYNNIDPQTGTGGWANLGTAGGGALGVHVVNAWTSSDGLSLWLTYSSDGKAPPGALFPPEGTMLDSFNLVNARLIPVRSAEERASR